MKKRLLNEQKTRRFMKLAGIRNLSENFIDETDVEEGEDLEEGEHAKADDMEEGSYAKADDEVEEGVHSELDEQEVDGDTLADFLDFIAAKVEDYADEKDIDLEVDVEEEPGMEDDDMDMDLEMDDEEGDEPGAMDLEMDDEEGGMDLDAPEMEDEEDEPSMEEELVNEVARRVALRILSEMKQ
jgi:hypothetical protein